jgi:predicted ArsR family transcriptional regulator
VYRRSDTEIGVSLPERRYDLAGGLLAEAVERSSRDGEPVARALRRAATEAGRRIGEAARVAVGRRSSRAKRRDAVVGMLERHGYEPHVCGMNLELLSGVIGGADGADVLAARLAPQPGYCCVRMKAS